MINTLLLHLGDTWKLCCVDTREIALPTWHRYDTCLAHNCHFTKTNYRFCFFWVQTLTVSEYFWLKSRSIMSNVMYNNKYFNWRIKNYRKSVERGDNDSDVDVDDRIVSALKDVIIQESDNDKSSRITESFSSRGKFYCKGFLISSSYPYAFLPSLKILPHWRKFSKHWVKDKERLHPSPEDRREVAKVVRNGLS